MSDADVLFRLEQTLRARRQADADTSYVAALYAKGIDAVLKKVGEESTEFILAAKSDDAANTCYEAADLVFHLLVALGAKNVALAEVLAELLRREGRSGIDEKNARGTA
jgi:phosphoribosyl-ATP pyrophosphohydrolase